MTLLIDAAYLFAGIILSPYILFQFLRSPRWRNGFSQRLGFINRRAGQRKCVWVHAVSVGELNAARPLIDLITKEHPDWDVWISTTTPAGRKIARERYEGRCFLFPLDLSFCIRNVIRRLRPDIILLVELELWPNFMRIARAKRLPVVIVNGRMRRRSVRRYRALQFLFRPGIEASSGNVFCVQSETYRQTFEAAGFARENIRVTGNMKYDAVRTEAPAERVRELRQALGIEDSEPVWIAACTWPGEEAICLKVHQSLQTEFPALRLIIAPRHIERATEVARLIEEMGYKCRRRSAAAGSGGVGEVALLDSVGELGYLYAIAQVVFVGKSLTTGGGHNMLEPAALGAVPVFGPLTENFHDESELLLQSGAAVRAKDESELAAALSSLLKDDDRRRQCAQNGRKAVLGRQGPSRKHLEVLQELLAESNGQGI